MLASVLGIADDKNDKSTKVTATVKLPKELASFTGRTLELRLYEYDPLLADVSADLVEKIAKAKFSHSKGKPTELKIEIGANQQIKPTSNKNSRKSNESHKTNKKHKHTHTVKPTSREHQAVLCGFDADVLV